MDISKIRNAGLKRPCKEKMRLSFSIFCLLFLSSIFDCNADNIVVKDSIISFSGRVINMNNEPLVGATLYFKEIKKGVITDNKGYFHTKQKAGIYTVEISYVGNHKEFVVNTIKNNNLVFVIEDNTNLDEVVVTAAREDRNITSLNMGAHTVSLSSISKMPQMMGEVDVVKAIQLLPGVQPTSDGGAGFSVRGGGADQNLILLDNSTIYNASHILGLFSVFNNDVIKGADLYKGDMPMKFGGRLSSLLQIHTKDELIPAFTMTGGIGLLASRLTVAAPIGKKTSVIVGGRRSYADLFLKMDKNHKDDDLYFYDANIKLLHKFSAKSILELNGYIGRDLFGMGGVQTCYYGNSTLSLIWKSIFSDSFSMNIGGNMCHYGYGLESNLKNSEMKWKADITDYSGFLNFINLLGNKMELNYGISGTLHLFNPGIVTQPKYDDFVMPKRRAFEYSFYVENKHQINSKFSAKYGLRVTSYNNVGKGLIYNFDENHNLTDSIQHNGGVYNTYVRIEPRIGLVYMIDETSSLKANYVHNVQFMQIANNSSAGSPLDMWFCAGPNVKPQEADIFSIGYFKNIKDNMYETSCELYYRKVKNGIDFADHAELLLNKQMEGELRIGSGKAYGLELMVKKNKGNLTGFINYTLSRSTRKAEEINFGKEYLTPYDRTHCLNLTASYKLSPKSVLSATFVYSTGAPTTYPVGRMKIGEEYYPIYSKRNEYRKPDYHRLDLAWTYNLSYNKKRKWKDDLTISIYNAYNRHNAWTISYDSDEKGPYAEKVYLFGILPSITYNFKF